MKTRYKEIEDKVGVGSALVGVLLWMVTWNAIEGYVKSFPRGEDKGGIGND